MTEKFKVVVTTHDGRGNYTTEVIRSSNDFEEASDMAYYFNGCVVEEEEEE